VIQDRFKGVTEMTMTELKEYLSFSDRKLMEENGKL
jgi:hypothetical protein